MARYAIPSDNAYGVTMTNMKVLAKRLGREHELAAALWDTGVYEARMLASLVDEPARVTSAQMDRWCSDFDNWAICDTACFALFDRTPHAWDKVAKWAAQRDEFVKRAAFALRRPDSWGRAIALGIAVLITIAITNAVLDPLLHGGREQGLTPSGWQSSHAAAF